MDGGYTDVNYSFWGTWSWLTYDACTSVINGLDNASTVAEAVKEFTSVHNGAAAMVAMGVSPTTVAATNVASEAFRYFFSIGSGELDNARTSMGVAGKAPIVIGVPLKLKGQYVFRLL